METLSLFSLGKMPKKGRGIPKLDRSRNVAGLVNIIQSVFFPGSSGSENRFKVFKNFLGGLSLRICEMSLEPQPHNDN